MAPHLAARSVLAVLVCTLHEVWNAPWAVQAQKTNPFALHIPRITLEELQSNTTLRTGHHAYIITDVVGKWKAINYTLDSIREKIPFEWVDFYRNNMADVSQKPFLLKVKDAIPDFQRPSPVPRYMQLRISLKGWKRMRKEFGDPEPDLYWNDAAWAKECMRTKDNKTDEEAIDNFYTTMQWKFMVIGEKDTTMFFHKDKSPSASWYSQLAGSKRFTFCPNSESHLLSNHINTHNPDYNRFPKFAKAYCGQATVFKGELLYYPGYMWHHALNLETPTIAYLGALVGTEDFGRTDLGKYNVPHKQFYKDVLEECSWCWKKGNPERLCDDISLQWPGAAPPKLRRVCEEYLPRCYKLWDKHVRTRIAAQPPAGKEEL